MNLGQRLQDIRLEPLLEVRSITHVQFPHTDGSAETGLLLIATVAPRATREVRHRILTLGLFNYLRGELGEEWCENRSLRAALYRKPALERQLGRLSPMQRPYALAHQLIRSDDAVVPVATGFEREVFCELTQALQEGHPCHRDVVVQICENYGVPILSRKRNYLIP